MKSPAPPLQPTRNQPYQVTTVLANNPPAKITCSQSLLQQDCTLLCSSHTQAPNLHPIH